MEFKTQEEINASLAEWQMRLFLTDWLIKASIVPLSEISLKNCLAENEYQSDNKCAIIKIAKIENSEDESFKTPQELTLVHELLHPKFIFTDNAKDTIEGNFMGTHEHALIEQMAKSLIMAKYNLTFDWFKNF